MNIQEMKAQINAEAARKISAAKSEQKRKLAALTVLAGGVPVKNLATLVREAIPTITGPYTARTVAEKIRAEAGISVPVSQVSTALSKMYNDGLVYRAQKGIRGKTPHVYQRPMEAEVL